MRLPDGDEWDALRRIADAALFRGGEREIRFAALSLDGEGLPHYGACALTLRVEYTADRSTVFEQNSAVFALEHTVADLVKGNTETLGRRAVWGERAKLCVAKLAHRIDSTTSPAEFPRLLLSPGPTAGEDDFVEVHIWGGLTAMAIEQVVVHEPNEEQARARGIAELLERANAAFVRRPPRKES